MYEAGKINVGGSRIGILVDDDGRFWASTGIGEPTVGPAPTRQELIVMMNKAIRQQRAKVTVAFTEVNDSPEPGKPSLRIRHGVCTGIHSANRNLLIRWESGQTSQEYGYGGKEWLRPLAEAEADVLLRLVNQRNEAVHRLAEFYDQRRLDVGAETKAAVAKSIEGVGDDVND
jgi:hypothetical protein